MSQTDPVVQLSKLKFRYEKTSTIAKFSKDPKDPNESRWILDIPDLTVKTGEHTFIYGPSGSGKTTLLGLLAGILQPQEGRVTLLGRRLSSLQGSLRDRFRGDHIGYIFQMFNLIPYLTVRQNILLPLEMSRLRASRLKRSVDEEVSDLASGLGIAALLDKPVTELSVGQQQRVAAARALMGRPEILIADEPTSALDFNHRENFLKTMFSAAEKAGTTVLFVSHDQTLRPLFARCLSLPEVNRVPAEV